MVNFSKGGRYGAQKCRGDLPTEVGAPETGIRRDNATF